MDFHSYYSFLYLSYGQFYAVMYFKILLVIQIDYHLGTDLSNPEGFYIQYQVILHFIGLLKYYFRNFMNFSGLLIYSFIYHAMTFLNFYFVNFCLKFSYYFA